MSGTFKPRNGIEFSVLSKAKFSSLFSFLTMLVVMASGSSALAIRFHSEDDGGFRRTLYPDAVRNVVHRGEELKAMAQESNLAALFPYLELTEIVKGREKTGLKKTSTPFINFLNESAELIVAQSPAELQLPLRRMYFAGESVKVSNALWRESNGSRHVRGLLLSDNAIVVEIVPGLEDSPGLQKLHRLIAMIEIGQAQIAPKMNQGAEYRLYFPVLDMLNKIVTGLFVDEVLKKMGSETIRQELAKIEVAENVKASLQSDFLERGFMHSKSMAWIMENSELRGPQLVEWVRELQDLRDQRARAIKGLSAFSEKVEALVRQDLLTVPSEKYFLLARHARATGDEKTFRIASELMVSRSGGAGQRPGGGGPLGPAPSCEHSFVAQ